MTAAAAAPGDDAVLPFQLDALDIRGRVARLDATLDRMLSQHAYPPSVGALIGEAALLTVMIGQAMKLRGRFSIQVRGDGPISLIATDYFAPESDGGPARLRAYASYDKDATPALAEHPRALLGEGLFAMTIDQGEHMKPYQGVTPLIEDGLAGSAEAYFAQSEQVATRFKIAIGQVPEAGGVDVWRAGGLMIQHLAEFGEGAAPPDGPSHQDGVMRAEDIAELGDRPEDWRTAATLMDTAEELELIGPHVSPEQLLFRLFHEVTPRVYPPEHVAFGCTCAPETVFDLLKQYPRETIADMTADDGLIHADCQFCGARYSFTVDELASDEPTGEPH